ncbi:MAG: hypothetical protein GX213_11280 [Clostridiaceae bacterium]|nr:hypothetical protein [Clostridiaceae bacterium]
MKKWKKNFRKIPSEILNKLKQIDSNEIIVACAKKIPVSDIENGIYEHVGITISNSSISFDESITPEPDTGRYSKYNVFGRVIILKHLPKITVSYSAEVPDFGDWSKGSHDITWTREVYQRETWMPRNLCINIQLLEQKDDESLFKFSIDTPLSKLDSYFMDDLLYYCNLLQENVGACDVFASDSKTSDYIDTLYVDWELLPPGTRNIDRNAHIILSSIRNPNPNMGKEIKERMEFFESLNLQAYIRGKNKFSQYFGAVLKNGLVILENIRYGNAIYIFKKNWEEFSKLSRTELLSLRSTDIIRVIHTNNWKNNIRIVVERASS